MQVWSPFAIVCMDLCVYVVNAGSPTPYSPEGGPDGPGSESSGVGDAQPPVPVPAPAAVDPSQFGNQLQSLFPGMAISHELLTREYGPEQLREPGALLLTSHCTEPTLTTLCS